MKVIIESIITLVEETDLQDTLARKTKFANKKVKDEVVTFVLDTTEIFNIAKTEGLEGANNAIDKVLTNYGNELKAKLSSTINN
jgi:adenine deaminase